MKTFKIVVVLVFLCLTFFASSCGIFEKKQPQKTIFVLFDLSESTNKPAMRKSYVDSMSVVMEKLTSGDTLAYDNITEASLEKSTLKVVSIPKTATSGDADIVAMAKNAQDKEQYKEQRKKLLDDFGLFLNNSAGHYNTAILSSMQTVDRVFGSFKKNKKILVIFSDMIEDSKDYNFDDVTLTTEAIDGIIAKEKAKGRMPDLTGTTVYVVGATCSNADKYMNIQNFWMKYFKECGADLSKENYGTTLALFNQ